MLLAGLCLVLAVLMLVLLAVRPWSGWSWFFLPVAPVYGAVSVWYVPRRGIRQDLAMAGDYQVATMDDRARQQYVRGALYQLLWALASLVALVVGMTLISVMSSKVT